MNIGPEFLISTTTDLSQGDVSIATLADGRFIVTWNSTDLDQLSMFRANIRARIFNADGTPTTVNGTTDDFLINSPSTTHHFGNSAVTGLSDGRFAVTWRSIQAGTGNDQATNDIRGRMFNADGTPASVNGSTVEFLVHSTSIDSQSLPDVTALPGGRFVVTWTSFEVATANHDIRARLFNADGTPASVNGSSGDFVINTTTASSQFGSSIVGWADGHFVATWASDEGGSLAIRARLFNADGTPATVNGSTDDFLIGANANFHALEALPDGRFVVAWDGVQARIFNADGSPDGDPFAVSAVAGGGRPSISALPDGRFVIALTEHVPFQGGVVMARAFNPDGTPALVDASDQPFLINPANVYGPEPSVVALSDGRFFAGWTEHDGISPLFNVLTDVHRPDLHN
jgi:hypothetical protein